MNDERLKEPGGFDHFDELLEDPRYPGIRKGFFRRSATCSPRPPPTTPDHAETFSTIQNKWCSPRPARPPQTDLGADPTRPNMALTSWKATARKGTSSLENLITDDRQRLVPASWDCRKSQQPRWLIVAQTEPSHEVEPGRAFRTTAWQVGRATRPRYRAAAADEIPSARPSRTRKLKRRQGRRSDGRNPT